MDLVRVTDSSILDELEQGFEIDRLGQVMVIAQPLAVEVAEGVEIFWSASLFVHESPSLKTMATLCNRSGQSVQTR